MIAITKPFGNKVITIRDEYDISLPEYFITFSYDYLNGFNNVPKEAGVYFFYEFENSDDVLLNPKGSQEIVYVGQTNNLQRRLYQHFKAGEGNKMVFNNISVDVSEYNYMVSFIPEDKKYIRDFIEGYFIDILQPVLNKKHTKKSYYTGGGRPVRTLTKEYLHAMDVLKENSYKETEQKTGISISTLQRIKRQYVAETGDEF